MSKKIITIWHNRNKETETQPDYIVKGREYKEIGVGWKRISKNDKEFLTIHINEPEEMMNPLPRKEEPADHTKKVENVKDEKQAREKTEQDHQDKKVKAENLEFQKASF